MRLFLLLQLFSISAFQLSSLAAPANQTLNLSIWGTTAPAGYRPTLFPVAGQDGKVLGVTGGTWGLVTSTAAAGTLTGNTLAVGVTASSLLSAAGGTFGSSAFVDTSAGGNGAADEGKVAIYGNFGQLTATTELRARNASTATYSYLADDGTIGLWLAGEAGPRELLFPDDIPENEGRIAATRNWTAAGYQPLDADLTSIAALTTTVHGLSLLADLNAAASRATIAAAASGANADITSLTAPLTVTGASAASAPAQILTGAWYTGGTGTTTKPHFLIEPSGTVSNAWNTLGTALAVNAASGYTGRLIDLQVNGSSKLQVNSAGAFIPDLETRDFTSSGNITVAKVQPANNNAQLVLNNRQVTTQGTPHTLVSSNFFPVAPGTNKGIAFGISHSVNQTGGHTGDYTTFEIKTVESSATGTNKLLIDAQVGSVSKFKVDNTGSAIFTGWVQSNNWLYGGSGLSSASSNVTLGVQPTNMTSSLAAVRMAYGTMSQTSGSFAAVKIDPTYNQVTSTAANTDLLINRTQTAVGSGAQLLVDAQVGGVSQFKVTTTGAVTVNGLSGTGTNSGTIVYPEAYSAQGPAMSTDTIDDSVAINAAIEACRIAGGGAVQFGRGNYRANETAGYAIRARGIVELRGAGPDATTISTDNTLATAAYCLIAPYDYGTVTVPFTAEQVHVRDMTLTGTSVSGGFLHDLIGFLHCNKGSATNVKFGISGAHLAEIGHAKNIRIINCGDAANTDHGTAAFQLDGAASAGQSANPRFTATINGATTDYVTSGTDAFTLVPVASSASLTVGDHVVITGATGGFAASYNTTGGFRIVGIPDATSAVIDLPFPGATSVGTLTVSKVIDGVLIEGYVDLPQVTPNRLQDREWLDLCHNSPLGTYRNVTVQRNFFRPSSYTINLGGVKHFIGFDAAALPLEYSGLKIINNTFTGGGHSGWTTLISLHNPHSTTYRQVVRGVEISGNTVDRTGMFSFLTAGSCPNTDGQMRTSITAYNGMPEECWSNRDFIVRGNKINAALRGGNATSARSTRPFLFGMMDNLVCQSNDVLIENLAPEFQTVAWVSGNVRGFILDHVLNCTMDSNTVKLYADTRLMNGSPQINLSAYPYVFGCSAFEISPGYPGSQRWTNNTAHGYQLNGVGTDLIVRGFTEISTAGTTGVSSWLSSTNPQVKGIWQGNRVTSTPAVAADTAYGSLFLAVPNNASLSSTAVTAVVAETPGATYPGRHRWGYGPRTGTATLVAGVIAVTDTAITANTIITVNRSTDGGTIGCSYSVTRSVGASFTITSKDSAGATQTADTSVISYSIHEPA